MYRINVCIDLEKVEQVLDKIQNRTNLLSLDSGNLKIIHEVANLIKVSNLKIKYFISNRDENLYKIFKHHLYKVVNLCVLKSKDYAAFYRDECFLIFTYITRNFSCFITGSNKNEINNFKVKSSLCGDTVLYCNMTNANDFFEI